MKTKKIIDTTIDSQNEIKENIEQIEREELYERYKQLNV